MPLVDSLLTAVVRSDGDALVLHVGEKPYVVAAAGPVELSRQGLGLGAMEGMLAQLLTADALRALREMGAVEHELDDRPAAGGDRFTVVAARGGDDIWIEMRRHRRVAAVPSAAGTTGPVADEPLPPAVSTEAGPPPAEAVTDAAREPLVPSAAVESVVETIAADEPETAATPDAPVAMPEEPAPADATPPVAEPAAAREATPPGEAAASDAMPGAGAEPFEVLAEAVAALEADLTAELTAGSTVSHADMAAAHLFASDVEELLEAMPELDVQARPVPLHELTAVSDVAAALDEAARSLPTEPFATRSTDAPSASRPSAAATPQPMSVPAALPPSTHAMSDHVDSPAAPASWAPSEAPRFDSHPHESVRAEAPAAAPAEPGLPDLDSASSDAPAVVLSLTRDGARGAGSGTRGPARPAGIDRLLRLAVARGASALYLSSQARPSVRIDGDVRLLDGEGVLSSAEVEAAVLELAPAGTHEHQSAAWTLDVAEVGRVSVTSFRDHRGPGAHLRIVQARATSAEQLGLVREIQALASEPEGIVLVTGPRASGKSTLLAAFVDLINRQRNDYIITLEDQVRLVHESRGSLISQRELGGRAADAVAAARAALGERPDVLVIDGLRSPEVLQVALDAAGSGLLVLVSVAATSSTAALERLIALCPSDDRRNVRAALAEHLRGVVAQVLLRKTGGGRLAARELVRKSPAVSLLVSDGPMSHLPRAIDGGRTLGMAPLNDALVAFVQSGAVDVREAYRKADDKAGLLTLLRREGIDTSFVERLA